MNKTTQCLKNINLENLKDKLKKTTREIHLLELSQLECPKAIPNLIVYRELINEIKKNKEKLPSNIVERKLIAAIAEMEMEKRCIKAPFKMRMKYTSEKITSYLTSSKLRFLFNLAGKPNIKIQKQKELFPIQTARSIRNKTPLGRFLSNKNHDKHMYTDPIKIINENGYRISNKILISNMMKQYVELEKKYDMADIDSMKYIKEFSNSMEQCKTLTENIIHETEKHNFKRIVFPND